VTTRIANDEEYLGYRKVRRNLLLGQQTHGHLGSKPLPKQHVHTPPHPTTTTVMHEVQAWVASISSNFETLAMLERKDCSRPHLKRTHDSPNLDRRIRPRLGPSAQSSTQDSLEMDSIADASSVTSLDSRRKLKATSPLMKRKGSQSFERTQRVLLKHGKPPIRIRQPDSTSRIISSEEIQGILSEDFSDSYIPMCFRVRYRVSST
jgi:hypothetical protein